MSKAGGVFPLRLSEANAEDVGEWANKKKMSQNAAINFILREYFDTGKGQVACLQLANTELRKKIVELAMAKANVKGNVISD